jgi:hypothetical protein
MPNVTFYRICCKSPNECSDVYIGHTTNATQKKHTHKLNSKNLNKRDILYTTIRSYGGWGNWDFIIISCVMVNTKDEISQYEMKYGEEFGNTLVPESKKKTPPKMMGTNQLTENIIAQMVQKQHEFEKKQQLMAEKHQAMLMDVISQNKELTQRIVEISKDKTSCNSNNTNSNNTVNNKFNLNLFLNETCKNAPNLSDYVKQIKYCVDDLIHTGDVGFANGMAHIFLKGLATTDLDKRPIHCTDLKRETLYIKENDVWEKEDADRTHMTNAMRQIGRENLRTLVEWTNMHPDYNEYDSKANSDYMRIIGNLMPGCTDEEIEKSYKKTIRTVAQEVPIPKS